MRPPRRTILALLIALPLASCSLMGLTEGLEPAVCTGQPGFCDDLNDSNPTEDPCLRWQCDVSSGFCAVLPTDSDEDGYIAAGCGDGEEIEDCDDSDSERSPGSDEICDGVDNDCDDIIDEGVLDADRSHLGQIASGGGLHGLSYSVSSVGRPAAAGLSDDESPAAALLPEGLDGAGAVAVISFTRERSPVSLSAQAVAIAASAEATVVAVATSDHGNGCLRLLLGQVNQSGDSLSVAFDDAESVAHFDEGLADESGERCAPGYQIATPAMSAAGDDLLLAYVGAAPESRAFCRVGSTEAPSPAPILLSYARRRSDGTLARDEIPSAQVLGQSTDNGAPAILSLESGRWLVSFVDAGGAVVIHLVERVINADRTRELAAVELYRVSGDTSAPRGELVLSSGSQTEGLLSFALAYREGCGGEAKVEVHLLELDTTTDAVTDTVEAISIDSGSRQDQRRPSLAWWDSADKWLVAYQQGLNQVASARFDSTGNVIDEEIPLLLEVPEPESGSRPAFAEPTFAFPMNNSEGYGLIGYIPGDIDPGLWGARLGCD